MLTKQQIEGVFISINSVDKPVVIMIITEGNALLTMNKDVLDLDDETKDKMIDNVVECLEHNLFIVDSKQ